MKAAVIGYGVIGKHHVEILSRMDILTAVCDIDIKALSGLDRVELYSDYLELLDNHRPDSVHICTPHYLHADMIIEALSRNINVLCEKPLCIKREDIERILEAEKHSTAILGVCHQNRYNPANLFVKEYISDKVVEGGVGQMSWKRDAEYYASAEWRGKWETEGGGVLINQALHTLDLMQWFCGMPESLSASVSNLTLGDSIEVEDTVAICAQGKAGFNFYASNGSAVGMPVEISLRVSGKTLKLMPKYVVINDGEVIRFDQKTPANIKSCYGSGHEALINDFYRAIEEGRAFDIDGEEAAKVVRLILATYESDCKSVKI